MSGSGGNEDQPAGDRDELEPLGDSDPHLAGSLGAVDGHRGSRPNRRPDQRCQQEKPDATRGGRSRRAAVDDD